MTHASSRIAQRSEGSTGSWDSALGPPPPSWWPRAHKLIRADTLPYSGEGNRKLLNGVGPGRLVTQMPTRW